jgi:hypothetical protein
MLPQDSTTPGHLVQEVLELIRHPAKRSAMQAALARWHRPSAAGDIAERMLHGPAPAASAGVAPAPKLNAQKLGPLNV